MSNVIKLLPDAVANQIAAGEVIQRPASVVKELVENSIDAGAKQIQLIVSDAGRELVQVIDNGCGMNETDARMSFERHATSKITAAQDLFAIRTMGFRGEALASIASVAQVELRTRRAEDEVGVMIEIAGSKIERIEQVASPVGTNFMVKNLFYNIPARRRFLKSNNIELRTIITEFQRIALANTDVGFHLVSNNSTLYQIPPSNLKQRIIHLMGKSYNNVLIPLEVETNVIKISGYIGKPEAAKKTSGDQYFFVNQRFMRSPYFNKAVTEAFQKLLPAEYYPSYFLYFEVDPNIIDVNIHPTKTEIKFEDERTIWHILNASVRECLGKHNMVPSIDFDTQGAIDIPMSTVDTTFPEIDINPNFNPFEQDSNGASSFARSNYSSGKTAVPQNWDKLYNDFETDSGMGFDTYKNDSESVILPSRYQENSVIQSQFFTSEKESSAGGKQFYQLKGKYILTSVKSGLMMIDQKRAHERILFEELLRSVELEQAMAQQILFPEQINLAVDDALLLTDLLSEIRRFGIDIRATDATTFDVFGLPAGLENSSAIHLIDSILEAVKSGECDVVQELRERIATSMVQKSAIPYGKFLNEEEMKHLFDQLFSCAMPNYSPSGKSIISILSLDELDTRF